MARTHKRHIGWIHLLFFCSGFPALIYQIVWQRALFAIYGLNIESVTIVVSGFMLGLGLGSLVGGRLSISSRLAPVKLFAMAEMLTGIFGVVSLKAFRQIAGWTVGASLLETRAIGFLAIVLSTLLMGATLPLLHSQPTTECMFRAARSSLFGQYDQGIVGIRIPPILQSIDVLCRPTKIRCDTQEGSCNYASRL